jgi:hypothetical protein
MYMTKPIFLRVPEDLKRTVENRAAEEGVSVNEWAVRALKIAASPDEGHVELDTDVTIEFLKAAAAAPGEKTVAYGEIASHQALEWSWAVKHAMQRHLAKVWEECRRRGLPSLTSLVVTKATGRPSSGYLRLEREAGKTISDEATFIAEQQMACRQWARRTLRGEGSSLDPWMHLRGTWKGPDVENFQDFMRGPPDETAATTS